MVYLIKRYETGIRTIDLFYTETEDQAKNAVCVLQKQCSEDTIRLIEVMVREEVPSFYIGKFAPYAFKEGKNSVNYNIAKGKLESVCEELGIIDVDLFKIVVLYERRRSVSAIKSFVDYNIAKVKKCSLS